MTNLWDLVPDVDVLLALDPEELAGYLLQVVRAQPKRQFHQAQLDPSRNQTPFDRNKWPDVELATAEAFAWLTQHGLLIPEEGSNGQNGWFRLSRRAAGMANPADFAEMKRHLTFPRELLHQSIATVVWLALARGALDQAVFIAFKTVEVAVRDAAGAAATDIGVALMRKAFDKHTGVLSKMQDPEPEREALAHLFAGAIGSYKNPHSHRTVALLDSRDAQEMVMLASHLLRIVDARRPT